MTDLTTIASLESSGAPAARPSRRRRRWRPTGCAWTVLWLVLLVWSTAALVQDGSGLINPRGWPAFAEFWTHAVRPDLSAPFLRATVDATLTTLAFAVLGTGLSVVLGILFAPVLSRTWWVPSSATGAARGVRTACLLLARVTGALPRGVHEAVWGLLLISVLGRDPLVGVLAIAVPFGAITAKVYSELLDEADHGPYEQLRALGAGRTTALAYGLVPALVPSATSYAFYRFECSIRSAVILGMVGAGGLGLQLSLSFAGSRYDEMWTSLFAMIVLGALVDRWGAVLRGGLGSGRRRWQLSALAAAALGTVSVVHLAPDTSRWFSGRTLELLGRLVDDLTPPALPAGGWAELTDRSLETLQMSVVGITLAAAAGVLVALVAARGGTTPGRRVLGWAARQLLLVTRAIPPPVWALLVLFVVLPGPLPGALALGIYTFGILGRLFAEVVEELDRRPRDALTALGAPPSVSFAYATLPTAAGQLLAYALYRWEVTARETVVVGVVGAGGLGRLLEQQRAGFDYPAMTTTVLALVVMCVVVDLMSLAVRTSLR